MLGDGCFYEMPRCYQISISFNKLEIDYLNCVLKLFKSVYPKEKFSISELKNEFLLRTYSRKVSNDFFEMGLKTGRKTKRRIVIPNWIKKDRALVIVFLRGIFDTDGCLYRKYGSYMQIQMKLANKQLVRDIRAVICRLNFNPTKIIMDFEKIHKVYEWKFYLSRQAEIHKFIKLIKLRNSKHITRYAKLWGHILTWQNVLAKKNTCSSGLQKSLLEN